MNPKIRRRLYHFWSPDYVLENIANRRLKVARFSKCNDPFELAAFSLKSREIRKLHEKWLAYLETKNGLICFCRSWRNPVLWSHYANHHKGLCLAFDVLPDDYLDVRYTSERLYPGINKDNFFQYVGEDQLEEIVSTKFIHWSYEEEVRRLIEFKTEPENKEICFYSYSDELLLRQVIMGLHSEKCVEDIYEAIGKDDVEVFQTRRAFQSFAMVRQEKKELWNWRNQPS